MDPPKTPTQKRLDDAKDAAADRTSNWFWFDVGGGYEFVSLAGLHSSAEPLTQDFLPASAHGGVVGAGLGAHLLFFTIGPRGRIGVFKDFMLFDIGGELGLRIPVGAFEPFFTIEGGYTALRPKGELLGTPNPIRVRGGNVRFGAGFDGYITRWFSLGAVLGWDVLAWGRPAVDAATIAAMQAQAATSDEQTRAGKLASDGSSVGTAVTLAAQLGLHF